MDDCRHQLRERLARLSRQWRHDGKPTFQAVQHAMDRIEAWKQAHDVAAIWHRPPLMATATLDDGLGQGLRTIQRVAETMGMRIHPLGLLIDAASIAAACRRLQPDLLGLTVLQLDTDAELDWLVRNLPPGIRLIAGGPAFQLDPDLGPRCRISFVARQAADFIDYMLDWSPDHADDA